MEWDRIISFPRGRAGTAGGNSELYLTLECWSQSSSSIPSLPRVHPLFQVTPGLFHRFDPRTISPDNQDNQFLFEYKKIGQKDSGKEGNTFVWGQNYDSVKSVKGKIEVLYKICGKVEKEGSFFLSSGRKSRVPWSLPHAPENRSHLSCGSTTDLINSLCWAKKCRYLEFYKHCSRAVWTCPAKPGYSKQLCRVPRDI